MKKLLEKLYWKTRKLNLKFKFLTLYLNSRYSTWGFSYISITSKGRGYSLLELKFRLPNKTTVKEFSLDEWDILFLNHYLYKKWEKLDDAHMWNSRSLSSFQMFLLTLLDKLYN